MPLYRFLFQIFSIELASSFISILFSSGQSTSPNTPSIPSWSLRSSLYILTWFLNLLHEKENLFTVNNLKSLFSTLRTITGHFFPVRTSTIFIFKGTKVYKNCKVFLKPKITNKLFDYSKRCSSEP